MSTADRPQQRCHPNEIVELFIHRETYAGTLLVRAGDTILGPRSVLVNDVAPELGPRQGWVDRGWPSAGLSGGSPSICYWLLSTGGAAGLARSRSVWPGSWIPGTVPML